MRSFFNSKNVKNKIDEQLNDERIGVSRYFWAFFYWIFM